MAHDRYRYDRDRYRDDDGYIARRGFGNERTGYESRNEDRESRRHRDFGDSAGYGSGGSARDWHDVVGEDEEPGWPVFRGGMGRRGDWSRGEDWGYPRSAYGRREDRYGPVSFGRGSRDYEDEEEDRGIFERAGDEIRSWFGDEDAERRRDRDMREAESHRGRGPKGYRRSDERILEDVNDRLTDDPHIDASEIEVTVTNREVTLNGTVNSRFEKRHAEDLADAVSGVMHVQNNLRVVRPAERGLDETAPAGEGARRQRAGVRGV